MKTCETCHHDKEKYAEACETCTAFDHWEPMTNADKVRTMSDVDLARTFAKTCGGTVGQYLEWLRKTE